MNLEWISPNLFASLVDFTLQATLLLAVVGSIVFCRPQMSAARRHFLLAAALLTLPLLMLCGGLAPVWQPFQGAGASARVTLPAMRKTLHVDGRETVAPVKSSSAPIVAAERRSSAWNAWAVAWLAGIAAGLLSLFKAAFDLRRLWSASTVEGDPRVLQIYHEAQRALTIALPDKSLRRSSNCQAPMTWGLLQRVVLLPEKAQEWSDARLRLVLRHELAHVARNDVVVSVLTTLSALLLWFHPLAWLMWKWCNQSREQACDDIALQHAESSREDFADELLQTVSSLGGLRRCSLPLGLAMASSSHVRAMKTRISSILDAARGRSPWRHSQRMIVLGSVGGLSFILAGLTACREIKKSVEPQVQISSKVFEVSTRGDSTALSDLGFTPGDEVGLQMVGIHDAKALEKIIEKIKSRKGVDLLTAPSVTTRNNQTAKVEVVREFIYPTEFDPPSLPDFADGKPVKLESGQSIAVTPTTPTAFEMRPVGVQMQFTPEIMEDGSISLQVTPEVTEFEGFKNYGSPIKATTVGADGKIQESTLTENKVEQPMFRTVKTSTSVVVRDGSAAIFGGLMRKDVEAESKKVLTRSIFFIIQAKIVRP